MHYGDTKCPQRLLVNSIIQSGLVRSNVSSIISLWRAKIAGITACKIKKFVRSKLVRSRNDCIAIGAASNVQIYYKTIVCCCFCHASNETGRWKTTRHQPSPHSTNFGPLISNSGNEVSLLRRVPLKKAVSTCDEDEA